MKIKWMITVMAAVMLTAASAAAEEGRVISKREMQALYPTTQEIYEDCKAAVKLYETDKKGFMRSYCAGAINGFTEGVFFAAPSEMRVHKKNDPCGQAKEDYIGETTRKLCVVIKPSLKDAPPQLSIATDFLTYIESLRTGQTDVPPKQFLNSPGNLVFAGFFSEVYQCNNNGEK